MRVSAIIPAYNEEGWVGKTVLALRELSEINEIIVVDDGSTDGTYLEAWNAGATVCRFSSNRGKSRALREGVALARGDVLAFVDADLCETALQFRRLISCIAADRADMAIASFGAKGKRGLGLVRALAYWGIRYHTGQSMNTPLSGQRVLKRVLWDSLNFRAEGFAAEVALTIESLKKGFRVIEIPLEMNHRVWGNDYASFMHRGGQFYDLIKLFWKKEY
ncbi:MAG TPA: glycosyl transferase [Firmicutes bacterium]|jgi:glycosyltransferase involved in cell wall biosynthesis|nr:glycosyltransferase family 2 protein [Bacillota bacterium]HAA34534.1 glycosyl transferase [Bacillota bacterium]